MSHPFGDLVGQHVHRRHGLTQAKLAEGILQPAVVITLMCQGKRLTGPQPRDRVLAIITWLHEQGVLPTLVEANALLNAAGMADLDARHPEEVQLLNQLAQYASESPAPSHMPAPVPPRRTNLPVHLTSFIGREQEMSEITRLLSGSRLVTLSGAGGIGKTRLAIEVARTVCDRFPDGVWLVEFAPLADSLLVPQLIAGVMDIRDAPDRPLLDTLIEHLRPKRLMLVLDNCEHLVDACARVIETLLQRCPNLHVLATSREVFGIPGETLYRVPSLSIPEHSHNPLPNSLTQFDAVRLFVDRSAMVQPGFALTQQNAPAVAQICRRLDGIPLALELAAARMSALQVEQVAAHLDDLFRLLTGGSRTALPRQQTLRASIAWNYDLLSETESRVFRRLAVFRGGWTLEAAEAVCASEDETDASVLEILVQLVNKSLVMVDEKREALPYRMLEPVHEYTREQLIAAGEAEAIRQRHAHYYLQLAEQIEPELYAAEQERWVEYLELEYDNLRASLQWALDREDQEPALRLSGALWRYWLVRSYFSEGRNWLERALAIPDPTLPQDGKEPAETTTTRNRKSTLTARATALIGAGMLAFYQGDYGRAEASFGESLTLFKKLHDQRGTGMAITGLAHVVRIGGNYRAARAMYEESATILRQAGATWWRAYALIYAGFTHWMNGEYATARPPLEEALLHLRAIGNRWAIAHALYGLGCTATGEGHYQEAYTLLAESLAIQRGTGDKRAASRSCASLGETALAQHDYTAAYQWYDESISLSRDLNDRFGIAMGVVGLTIASAVQWQPVYVARLLGAVAALFDAIGIPLYLPLRADYERTLAAVRAKLGDAAFMEAWNQGQSMTPEQAIASQDREQQPEPPSNGVSQNPLQGFRGLTAREIEVLRLVAQGLTDAQVAEKLVISARTVNAHLRTIYGKLEVTSRSAATRYALEHHLE